VIQTNRKPLKTVGIPKDLYMAVERFIEKYPRYVSVSEFVREAVREKLTTLENNLKVLGDRK